MRKKAKTSPAYWENQLRKRGLGVDQFLTDNSEGGLGEVKAQQGKVELNKDKDRAILRQFIDGSDPYMTGFSTKAIRSREWEPPEWAMNDMEVQRVILTAFPKAFTNHRQRKSAARWVHAIQLRYRMGLPWQIVEKEMGINENTLKLLLRRINKVAAGTVAGRGRPKKGDPSPSTLEGTGEKGDV